MYSRFADRGRSLLLVACVVFGSSCGKGPAAETGPVKVEIVSGASGYQLLRGGEPYTIRGAGMPDADFENFAAHGGNSVRNWSTTGHAQDTLEFLDAAHAHGVTVALCLSLQPERWGFDYDDADAVAAQFEAMRDEVLRYRDHPALLFWIIGNELDMQYENPAVYDAVNDVAKMIHDLDPNHPTTTTLSGFDVEDIELIRERAPDLDFLSFQLYGGLFALPDLLEASGFDEPFMVTEWGALGYWEMEQTAWGAPVELNSTEKADVFRRGWNEILDRLGPQLVGSYVFLWGQKQERTPTWFGLFTESGHATEAMDVMHEVWTGTPPPGRAPVVDGMRLDGKGARESVELQTGLRYEATLRARDPDGDSLHYRWELKPESDADSVGGDWEAAVDSLGLLPQAGVATIEFEAPPPGRYRLFAYAYDGDGQAAHANIPFRVPENLAQREGDLVAGQVMAVAYSGFRDGQHPDRGAGAVNPGDAEILEDLNILVDSGFRLIRLYDAGSNSRSTLALIEKHDLPLEVLLGIWLRAEVSNHEGCAWLDEPIPATELEANRRINREELQRGIALAREYRDIVVAVNVGNEALVEWNDDMVPVDTVIEYVREVRGAIEQPVTVADNYAWWARHGEVLAAEVDFIGIHTYPVWEGRDIDAGLSYTIENLARVRATLPGKRYAILEAGWATTASEFGDRASEAKQARYFAELRNWARANNVTVFFFEAFDESWKGDPGNPDGAEKHWGLFNVDRTPKKAMRCPDCRPAGP